MGPPSSEMGWGETVDESLLLGLAIALFVIAVVLGVAAWWATIDTFLATGDEWRSAGRHRWLWALGSFFVPFVGVYYLYVVRPQVRGIALSGGVKSAMRLLAYALAAIAVAPFVLAGIANGFDDLWENPEAIAVVLVVPVLFVFFVTLFDWIEDDRRRTAKHTN